MRRAARKDKNQNAIAIALESAGAAVTDLSKAGGGVTDLLVSYHRRWFVLEVKNPDVPKADRELTPAQKDWHAKQRAPVHVVMTAEQALEAIGANHAEKLDEWVRNNIG
jgi:hypothetical protein